MPEQPKKLLDQVRVALIFRHNSYCTEQSTIDWIIRCILFLQKRHPKDIGELEIEAFLAYLAQERHVVASTQNQAFSPLLFLYRLAHYHISRIATDAIISYPKVFQIDNLGLSSSFDIFLAVDIPYYLMRTTLYSKEYFFPYLHH